MVSDPKYTLADWETVFHIMELKQIKDKADTLNKEIRRKSSIIGVEVLDSCVSELRYRLYRNLLGYYWKKL